MVTLRRLLALLMRAPISGSFLSIHNAIDKHTPFSYSN
jgi:hypothetical protein